MMISVAELRNNTLDALVEGRDVADWRDEARQFLAELDDAILSNERDLRVMALPIARRLLGCDDWQRHLTVPAVLDFCRPRAWVERLLNCLPRDLSHDAASEYMAALALELYVHLWGQNPWPAHRSADPADAPA